MSDLLAPREADGYAEPRRPPASAARIAPAEPPFPPAVQGWLDRTMPPGRAPLVLFTTLARDPRLFGKFFAAGLLERGHLALRERELVIARTTALCGSEYEWGVHIALFAAKAGFDEGQVASLARGGSADDCWGEPDRPLLRFAEELHRDANVSEATWRAVHAGRSDEAMLELLMLAGFYRTVGCLTNALRLPLEADGARFPA